MKENLPKSTPFQRGLLSWQGLAIGDAFGEQHFDAQAPQRIEEHSIPAAPWHVTDDTILAQGLLEQLQQTNPLQSEPLAQRFAALYKRDPNRGYGPSMHRIMKAIDRGEHWQDITTRAFDGMGSMGNGAAMRTAPLGAFFADKSTSFLIEQARLSAQVTHAHPDAHAGAIAVALAAAWLSQQPQGLTPSTHGKQMLAWVLQYTPEGETRGKLNKAIRLPFSYRIQTAVSALGNGSKLLASDTVPLALWCAAQHLDNFEQALWRTVSAGGDRDTLCAIVGGLVVLSAPSNTIPLAWCQATQLAPHTFFPLSLFEK